MVDHTENRRGDYGEITKLLVSLPVELDEAAGVDTAYGMMGPVDDATLFVPDVFAADF